MLFNPKWTDALSIDSLISWLETKDGSYEAFHVGNCLLCHYFGAMEYGKVECSHTYFASIGKDGEWINLTNLPLGFDWIATGGRTTFKSALKRARKWKAEHP